MTQIIPERSAEEPWTTFQARYRSDQPFADLEEACGFWEEYLGLAPRAERSFLRGFLAERLVREPVGWAAPYAKRALVIAWRVAR